MIKDLTFHLAAQTEYQFGKNLFIHQIPEEVDSAILLVGPSTGDQINPDTPEYFKSRFQMIVRSKRIEDGEETALQLMKVLNFGNLQVNSIFVKYVRPSHKPVHYPIENKRHEFSINFDICYVEKQE